MKTSIGLYLYYKKNFRSSTAVLDRLKDEFGKTNITICFPNEEIAASYRKEVRIDHDEIIHDGTDWEFGAYRLLAYRHFSDQPDTSIILNDTVDSHHPLSNAFLRRFRRICEKQIYASPSLIGRLNSSNQEYFLLGEWRKSWVRSSIFATNRSGIPLMLRALSWNGGTDFVTTDGARLTYNDPTLHPTLTSQVDAWLGIGNDTGIKERWYAAIANSTSVSLPSDLHARKAQSVVRERVLSAFFEEKGCEIINARPRSIAGRISEKLYGNRWQVNRDGNGK